MQANELREIISREQVEYKKWLNSQVRSQSDIFTARQNLTRRFIQHIRDFADKPT